MIKKAKKVSPTESFSNNNSSISSSNYDSRAYPSFLYQFPSFAMNTSQSMSERDGSKVSKRSKKSISCANAISRKEKVNKKDDCGIEGQDLLKKKHYSSSNSNSQNINTSINLDRIPDSSNVTANNNNNNINTTNFNQYLQQSNNSSPINQTNLNTNHNQISNPSNNITFDNFTYCNLSYSQQVPSNINFKENNNDNNSFIENICEEKPQHFSFENSKMIGHTFSSYVYSLYDKENKSINRALKLSLHPKLRHHFSNPVDAHQQLQNQFNQRCQCQMLKEEWNVLQKMDHPHVMNGFKLYENIEIEPNSFCCAIEMELAECNLHQLLVQISQHKQFCLNFVKRILIEVTSALNYFHNQANYTHNDIKADNIFIFFNNTTNQYFAKLADLGTAREYSQENHFSSNLYNNWKSRNPDYQPPEIIAFLNEAKNKDSIDQINSILGFDEKKADIFNLGTLFFAVLFQLRPFSCRGATENDPLYKLIFENRYEEFWCQEKFQRMLNYWASYQKHTDMIQMIQLITSMIQSDPSQRPTISQILSHPWFTQDDSLQNHNSN